MSKKTRKRIEDLERQVAYLEAMVRHYIALHDQGMATTTPTIVPNPPPLRPIPLFENELNIPFPHPLNFGTTQTPLPDPPYRVTCDGGMNVAAHEATLATAWWSPEDCEAWSDL